MNDEELRSLIRVAIQKHMSSAAAPAPGPERRAEPAVSITFGQYRLERANDDTACLIEPAVQCNHCGFCKCHGH